MLHAISFNQRNHLVFSFYERVCPSIRPFVHPGFIKNKGNQYLRANKCQRRFTRLTRCIIVSLLDIPLVHQSVSPSVCLSHREYQREFQLMDSQVISSSRIVGLMGLVWKTLIFPIFYDIVTDGPTDKETDGPTERWMEVQPFFWRYNALKT